MTTPTLKLSRNSFIGIGKESTLGTYVAPTFYVPGQRYAPEDVVQYEDDNSMKGNSYRLQAVVAGIKDGNFGVDALGYFELVGHLLTAAGYPDVIASGRSVTDGVDNSTTTITSATAAFTQADVGSAITGTDIPASTTIASVTNATTAVLSQAATATGSSKSWTIGVAGTTRHLHKLSDLQPASYSITDYNQLTASTGTRGYPGQMLDELGMTIDTAALIKFMMSWKGWPSASQSKPTPTYPSIAPSHGWQSSYTIGGSANSHILGADYSIKQGVETVHTGTNTQNPYDTFAGERDGSLKLKVAPEDETEFLLMLNNTQPTIVTTITSPNGSPAPVVKITSTVAAAKKAPLDRSGKYEQFNIDVDLVGNSTDGGPLQVLITNGVATAYSA